MPSKKISRREFASSLGAVLAAATGNPASSSPAGAARTKVVFSYTPQTPSEIQVLPGINIGRSFPFADDSGPCVPGKRYEPAQGGGFAIHNGPDTYNHILMGEGVWYLLAGDKPRFSLLHRTGDGSYAEPGILSGLGVGGRLRLAVASNGASKWLDQFESIDTQFAPGIATWECNDKTLGISLKLETRPLIGANGFITTATLHADSARAPHLTWAFGAIREKHDLVELMKNFARLRNPALPYTEILAGLVEAECEVGRGFVQILIDSDVPPAISPQITDACALYDVQLRADPRKEAVSQFVCVWGYTDYDRKGVDDALARLEGRPFADSAWLERMKKEWFHHWIGRGLEAEKKFLEIRGHAEESLQESMRFWDASKRIRIKTPDAAFDNVVNNEAANLRHQFEYPAFIQGLIGWSKYGKISCGYYGPEAAGYHEEAENSLKFISGTQDAKGRQRYFTPAFAISDWAEEQDFYYVEQVWYHYRWTGSLKFLEVMWPSVRRSLDHALAASDPDSDGIMTGYYEFWNNDMHSWGACAWSNRRWLGPRSAAQPKSQKGWVTMVRCNDMGR